MNGVLSSYLENKLIDLVMVGTAYSSPAAVYLGLCSTEPTDSGATEVVYTGYARQQIVFAAPSGRAVAQSAGVTFPNCTGGSSVASHYAVFDSESGGEMLGYGELLASKTIAIGNTPTVAAGQIIFTFVAAGVSTYLAHALLNHAFRATAYTAPANRCIALCTADLTDGSTGSTISEPSGNGYERKTTTGWTVTGGAAWNTNVETLATPSGSWGAIAATCITDASTGGNVLFYDNSPTGDGQTPTTGDVVQFGVGAFICSLD